MDILEYRKQYQKQLENAAKKRVSYQDFLEQSQPRAAGPSSVRAVGVEAEDALSQMVSIIQDQDEEVRLRISALQMISADIAKSHELIDQVLDLLRDDAESPELRLAALTVLEQISFGSALFRSKRPEYLEALRSIIDDKDTKLRGRAIEILAIEKDEYLQRRLLDQLQGRSKALVGTSKAIQLLGYDIHAEHYPILKEIVKNPPSRAAKKEAVRLLASDPSSKALLAQVLRDKDEHREVRKLSAVALQSLAPAEFEEQAKQIVLDKDEYDEIRTTSINALNQFANPDTLSQETGLKDQIRALNDTSSSRGLKQATARFISKQGE